MSGPHDTHQADAEILMHISRATLQDPDGPGGMDEIGDIYHLLAYRVTLPRGIRHLVLSTWRQAPYSNDRHDVQRSVYDVEGLYGECLGIVKEYDRWMKEVSSHGKEMLPEHFIVDGLRDLKAGG